MVVAEQWGEILNLDLGWLRDENCMGILSIAELWVRWDMLWVGRVVRWKQGVHLRVGQDSVVSLRPCLDEMF